MPFKDPERKRTYQRTRIAERRKLWFTEHGPCVDCGSWDRLELDHVDPSKKISHRIFSWSKERFAIEAEKCVVRCKPCHQSKTNRDCGFKIIPHGTHTGYSYHNCRCGECTEAHACYERERRRSRL